MKNIICWDFDETLGYFRPCEFSYLDKPVPEGLPQPFLKSGIQELLESLTKFTHIVTTAAIGVYAKDTLEKKGLLKYFDMVIGREDGIYTGYGKDYSVVGKHLSIPEEDFPKRLLIIGNDYKKDRDYYHRQIVMIYDEEMMNKPA